jgi:hypothetical protein
MPNWWWHTTVGLHDSPERDLELGDGCVIRVVQVDARPARVDLGIFLGEPTPRVHHMKCRCRELADPSCPTGCKEGAGAESGNLPLRDHDPGLDVREEFQLRRSEDAPRPPRPGRRFIHPTGDRCPPEVAASSANAVVTGSQWCESIHQAGSAALLSKTLGGAPRRRRRARIVTSLALQAKPLKLREQRYIVD